ncbi:MAG: trehalase family glycosidase [Clostridia bacterium]|nr:trehalase family glycosidase [Clostridia bacterium]
MKKYIDLIKEYSKNTYQQMVREPEGYLKEPFIVPGSQRYSNCLWDWDSWLTNIAVRQIMVDNDDYSENFIRCEKGCIINFLTHSAEDGRMPVYIKPEEYGFFDDAESNTHKPCLAQHAAFIIKTNGGDAQWMKPYIGKLKRFVDFYITHCRHEDTQLYFWLDDAGIGVDNDPSTFYRPKKSSASIYLNCLMYKELLALVYICSLIDEDAEVYQREAENLKRTIRTHLWDERDGFYYSADLNLLPVDENVYLHRGAPRHWNCLIQRIDVWSGFMAMWAGIATKEEADRMVKEHMLNEKTFWAPYGVRTLSKLEKMYCIKKSGNPSCWLGPIWGISNWMCFKGLIDYGFDKEAKQLVEKTIRLFGEDIERCGEMHEYYHPDTGEGVHNQGFQNWNLFVNNMIAWYERRELVKEF